ncbi:MAG: OmpH family outer membrane protein [Alistipes sp.]|nr:OmpH family outer membrane protein [Alistipes sp.]MDE7077167.1 OmpH family outer membrane protein [Alistipes sp.]MDE7344974.1 OmpH family outer membrane protein [Alistipes sp.]
MKRLLLLAAFLLTAAALPAQNCIVVNSEKVFKSLDAYNRAIAELDDLAEQYQKQVDARYARVETLYNNYMAQKTSLSAATRQSREEAILALEKEAADYQESIFGQEGTLMKRRVELIEPIQKKVFAVIEAYAERIGATVVLDSSNNPALLYTDPAAERTQQVIDALAR